MQPDVSRDWFHYPLPVIFKNNKSKSSKNEHTCKHGVDPNIVTTTMGNTCFNDYALLKQTNDLPLYSLKGEFRCKVVDVYDGDTVTIVIYNKGGYEKHKLRMYGYDSPEMKPSVSDPNRDEIIAQAKLAKQFIEERVLNEICVFTSMGYDKYGRLLGHLYTTKYLKKDVHINALMLAEGHGYAYTGGTKRTGSVPKSTSVVV